MKYILYKQRTFSDKFNLSFEWLRDNWKPVLKYVSLLLLPLSLLQGFGQNAVTGMYILGGGSMDMGIPSGALLSVGLYYLCTLLGGFLAYSLFFTFMKLSMVDGVDLNAQTFAQVWKAMRENMGRLFLGGLVLLLLTVIAVACAVAAAMAGPVGFVLFILLGIFLAPVIFPFMPAYLLGSNGLVASFQQGLRLGYKCWWGFVSTTVVMGLLASVLQGFGAVPFYICIFFKALFIGGSGDGSVLLDFLSYLSGVLLTYVMYVTSVLGVLMLTIQYGHAADKVDGVSSEREIEDF